MQAIEVKYHVDKNGNSKWIAKAQAKRKSFFQSDLQQELNLKGEAHHRDDVATLAAQRLARELEWNDPNYYGNMVMGALVDGSYVFVFTGRNDQNVIKEFTNGRQGDTSTDN